MRGNNGYTKIGTLSFFPLHCKYWVHCAWWNEVDLENLTPLVYAIYGSIIVANLLYPLVLNRIEIAGVVKSWAWISGIQSRIKVFWGPRLDRIMGPYIPPIFPPIAPYPTGGGAFPLKRGRLSYT